MDKKKLIPLIGGLFCIGLIGNIFFPNSSKQKEKPPPAKVEDKKKPEKETKAPPKVTTTSSNKSYSSIYSYLKNTNSFIYVTSMTDSISKSKADIYETDMTVDATITNLSSALKPLSKKVLLKNKAVILKYSNNEEVFIYLNEKNDTYIQVSNASYLKNQGYDATYRPGSFFRTYGIISLANDTLSTLRRPKSSKEQFTDTLKNSSKKNNKTTTTTKPSADKPSSNKSNSNSIKNSSVGSRPSTGGGTSFGK